MIWKVEIICFHLASLLWLESFLNKTFRKSKTGLGTLMLSQATLRSVASQNLSCKQCCQSAEKLPNMQSKSEWDYKMRSYNSALSTICNATQILWKWKLYSKIKVKQNLILLIIRSSYIATVTYFWVVVSLEFAPVRS